MQLLNNVTIKLYAASDEQVICCQLVVEGHMSSLEQLETLRMVTGE